MLEAIPEFGLAVSGVDYVLRPGGYLVVRNSQSEIAVVKTPRGFFLPGGGQDNGETPERAAIREAEEECGLKVELIKALCTADELVFAQPEQMHYRKRSVFFSAKLISVTGTGETDHELKWMTLDDAVRRLNHQSQAWAVTKAFAKTSG